MTYSIPSATTNSGAQSTRPCAPALRTRPLRQRLRAPSALHIHPRLPPQCALRRGHGHPHPNCRLPPCLQRRNQHIRKRARPTTSFPRGERAHFVLAQRSASQAGQRRFRPGPWNYCWKGRSQKHLLLLTPHSHPATCPSQATSATPSTSPPGLIDPPGLCSPTTTIPAGMWQSTAGSKELRTADYILRAVHLDAGQHTVHFWFLPTLFLPTAIAGLGTFLLIVLGIIFGGGSRKPSRDALRDT